MDAVRKDNYSDVEPEVAHEILRLAEVQLEALLKLSIGASQRATTLCGIFITSGIATLGGAIATIEKIPGLPIAGGLMSLMLVFSAFLCAAVIWPTNIYIAGTRPRAWMSDEALKGDLSDTMCHEAWNYDEYIENNRNQNKRQTFYLKVSVLTGCAAPLCGAALWAFLHFCLGGG